MISYYTLWQLKIFVSWDTYIFIAICMACIYFWYFDFTRIFLCTLLQTHWYPSETHDTLRNLIGPETYHLAVLAPILIHSRTSSPSLLGIRVSNPARTKAISVTFLRCCLYRLFAATDRFIRPPLWCNGQSSWLQIQRSRVRFPALPDFLRSSGSGRGSTQPREDNWGATWMEK
jgi:hypothetical protein